jgi:hypothetical protein
VKDPTAALRLMGLQAVDPVRAAAAAKQLGSLLLWLSEGSRTMSLWECDGWHVNLFDDGAVYRASKRDALDCIAHALIAAQAAEVDREAARLFSPERDVRAHDHIAEAK